jgi:hypothetical protein
VPVEEFQIKIFIEIPAKACLVMRRNKIENHFPAISKIERFTKKSLGTNAYLIVLSSDSLRFFPFVINF